MEVENQAIKINTSSMILYGIIGLFVGSIVGVVPVATLAVIFKPSGFILGVIWLILVISTTSLFGYWGARSKISAKYESKIWLYGLVAFILLIYIELHSGYIAMRIGFPIVIVGLVVLSNIKKKNS